MRLKKIIAAGVATVMLSVGALSTVSALEAHGTGIKMRNWLTNDPNYEFSDAYKTSVWYENFASLDFSENERNTVLRIAVSQLGYHEGDSAADFDGMNMSGSNNYIEYARLLVPHYNDNHYEWCACFVNWCLNQAHFDKASSEIGCWKWVGELKAMNMWQDSLAYKGTYTPKPADFIFFNWNGTNTGSGHIGYVLYTTDTHVFTIEGNADNNVTVRSYELTDPRVIGYGTPPYNEGEEPTLDFSYAQGRPRGKYVVNSMTARMKDENGKTLVRIPVGSCVDLLSVTDGVARISFKDQEGYIDENILVLMTPLQGTDKITYDANGGSGAPALQEIVIGEKGTLSADAPTLAGDTFLGWALRPYDMVPVYQPGDTVAPDGDITLYAIWEKHSLTLAEAALAEGTLVRFPMHTSIQHHAALIMGSVDPSVMTPSNGTTVTTVKDDTFGQVMSFASQGANNDPFVTLPYATLMNSVQLAPIHASDAQFVVMLVQNVSLNNRAFDLFYRCDGATSDSGDLTALVASQVLEEDEDWQFVIFDMREAKGWNGALQELRLDYQRSSLEGGETLLLQGVYFLKNEAEVTALTQDGIYFFPTQEKLPPETEAPTQAPEAPTEAPTDPVSDTETAPETGHTEAPTQAHTTAEEKGGCAATAGISALGLVLPGAWLLLRKRRHRH